MSPKDFHLQTKAGEIETGKRLDLEIGRQSPESQNQAISSRSLLFDSKNEMQFPADVADLGRLR